MLIICKSIQIKELKPLEHYFDIKAIKSAAIKAQKGLGDIISSPIKNSHIIKIYLTGKPAGRICFLIFTKQGDIVPLILRLKKDKKIGKNMSIQNSSFKKILKKNIKLALNDIKTDKYTEIELSPKAFKT